MCSVRATNTVKECSPSCTRPPAVNTSYSSCACTCRLVAAYARSAADAARPVPARATPALQARVEGAAPGRRAHGAASASTSGAGATRVICSVSHDLLSWATHFLTAAAVGPLSNSFPEMLCAGDGRATAGGPWMLPLYKAAAWPRRSDQGFHMRAWVQAHPAQRRGRPRAGLHRPRRKQPWVALRPWALRPELAQRPRTLSLRRSRGRTALRRRHMRGPGTLSPSRTAARTRWWS